MPTVRWLPFFMMVLTLLGSAQVGSGQQLTIWADVVDNLGPDVAFAPPHDTFLVVWHSNQDAFTWDIWARPVTEGGTRLTTFNVDTAAGYKMSHPTVAYGSAQDGYLVAYSVENATTGQKDIWARAISWNGPGTNSIVPIVASSRTEDRPAAAYNPQDDEFLVVYEAQNSSGRWEIEGVRLDAATGVMMSAPAVIAASPMGQGRRYPDVAWDPVNKRYVVVYEFYSTTTDSILIKTVPPDLTAIPAEQEVVDGFWAQGPALAVGPNEILVAWHQTVTGDNGVSARRTTLDGTPIGPANGFSLFRDQGYFTSQDTDISYDTVNGYLVVMEAYVTTPAGYDVRCRYVRPGQDQPSGEVIDFDTISPTERYPAVASNGDDTVLVVESYETGSDSEIAGFLLSTVFSDGFETGDTSRWSGHS